MLIYSNRSIATPPQQWKAIKCDVTFLISPGRGSWSNKVARYTQFKGVICWSWCILCDTTIHNELVCCANVDVMNTIAHELFQEFLGKYIRQVKLGEHQHIIVRIKKKRTAPQQNQVGVAPEVTCKWGEPCKYLDTWVRLSSLRVRKLLALQSATDARGREMRLGGAGLVNQWQWWGWPC